MSRGADYIHGSSARERARLKLMNELINARCLEQLALGHERLVLDVGSGTGELTRQMAAELPASSRVIGVERNPEQVREARASGRSNRSGAGIEYRSGDAEELPLSADERGRVDLAHARFLLEHVPDPGAVVRGMVRVLRPGGRIVLLDDDHELMRFWPEPEGLAAAWRAYYRSYHRLGTDPLVGRKLTTLLHAAGAEPRRIDHLFYGACASEPSFPGVVDNLIGVLEGARREVLQSGEIDAADYDRALDNLDAFKRLPDAAVWYVINWAEGRAGREASG